MSETQLSRSIQQRLELMAGVRCWRCNAGAGGRNREVKYGLVGLHDKSGAGTQDLIVCAAGLFIGLEVKLPKKKPSPAQLKRQAETREAGGISEVVCSVEEAVAVVEKAVRGMAFIKALLTEEDKDFEL